jgi:hypothetical protein
MKGSNVVYKAPVYDPNDVPRTTDKDTLLFERLGNSDAVESGTGYSTAPRDVTYTQKQFISDTPYTGSVSGSGGDAYKVLQTMCPHAARGDDHVYRAGPQPRSRPTTQNYARTFNKRNDTGRRDPAMSWQRGGQGVVEA